MAPEMKNSSSPELPKWLLSWELATFLLQKDMTIQTNYHFQIFGDESLQLMAGLLPDLAEGFPFPMDLPDLLGGLGGTGLGGLGAPMVDGKSPPTTGEAKGMKSLFGDLGTLEKIRGKNMGKQLNSWSVECECLKKGCCWCCLGGRVEALCPVEFLLLLDLCWLLEVHEIWTYAYNMIGKSGLTRCAYLYFMVIRLSAILASCLKNILRGRACKHVYMILCRSCCIPRTLITSCLSLIALLVVNRKSIKHIVEKEWHQFSSGAICQYVSLCTKSIHLIIKFDHPYPSTRWFMMNDQRFSENQWTW